MFAEDTSVFLADWGRATSWTPTSGATPVQALMLLDQPDSDVDGGSVTSREYQVTFVTSEWAGLKRNETLAITAPSGAVQQFKVRADPRQAEDGVFSTARLTAL